MNVAPMTAEEAQALSGRARRLRLTEYIQSVVVEVAGFDEAPAPDAELFSVGLRSIQAIEIRNRLEVDLDLILDDTLLIEEPTIHALATLLSDLLDENS